MFPRYICSEGEYKSQEAENHDERREIRGLVSVMLSKKKIKDRVRVKKRFVSSPSDNEQSLFHLFAQLLSLLLLLWEYIHAVCIYCGIYVYLYIAAPGYAKRKSWNKIIPGTAWRGTIAR